MTPEEFLGESALGRAVFETVSEVVTSFGDVTIRTTKVVASIALDRVVASPRSVAEVDDEVRRWLRAAYDGAA